MPSRVLLSQREAWLSRAGGGLECMKASLKKSLQALGERPGSGVRAGEMSSRGSSAFNFDSAGCSWACRSVIDDLALVEGRLDAALRLLAPPSQG